MADICDPTGRMIRADHVIEGMEADKSGAWCAVIGASTALCKSHKPEGVVLTKIITTGGPMPLLFPHNLVRVRDMA